MNNKLRLFFEFKIPLISYIILFIALIVLFFFNVAFASLGNKSSQIGALVLFVGCALRTLATLTNKYMGRIKITGVYALCRQPLLLAQIIMLCGMNVIVMNEWFCLISIIVFLCNDCLAYRKYDKILSHHYRDVWKIYAKHTYFLVPITKRVKDVFNATLSQTELDSSQNAPIFLLVYFMLIEIATFSNL